MDVNILERTQVVLAPAPLELSGRNELLTADPVQVRAAKGQEMLRDLEALIIGSREFRVNEGHVSPDGVEEDVGGGEVPVAEDHLRRVSDLKA